MLAAKYGFDAREAERERGLDAVTRRFSSRVRLAVLRLPARDERERVDPALGHELSCGATPATAGKETILHEGSRALI